MSQKTKIIATIGPASESSYMIEKLIEAGVNIFRLNLKHNTYKWHSNMVQEIRRISRDLDKTVGIIADLQGPELRTGVFANNVEVVNLTPGEKVKLSDQLFNIERLCIPFAYVSKIKNLKPDHNIFIDDGKIELKVERVGQNYVDAVVIEGGELGNRKSVSIPEADIDMPTLTEKDKKDIEIAVAEKVDFIALSFVRNEADIATLKKHIKTLKGDQHIIAKIETLKAIENFDSILDSVDGIMFARGDLGIEIPMERLPSLQKSLIQKSREKSKPIIIATQMLLSMVDSSLPSRAEVADIANAIFDKTDALMLSEETAIGKSPVKAVQTMSKIARYNESYNGLDDVTHQPESYQEILINASIRFIKEHPHKEENIAGFIVFTESGKSARMLSRFRTRLPIFAFSTHNSTKQHLTLSYGVHPYKLMLSKNPINNTKKAIEILKKEYHLAKGDRVIVIYGSNVGVPEANNNITVLKVN